MAKSNYLTTIGIDSARSTIHFYTMVGENRSTVSHHVKSFTGAAFDGEFFKKFKNAVGEFAADSPAESVRKVSVIIPDSAVLTDVIKIPTLRGGVQTKKALDITLSGLYKNFNDLRVLSYRANQNKQYTTFGISVIQRKILSELYAACSENRLLADNVTFASAATIGGAVMLNPKLKSASYLFLDLKDTYSRFIFVANGKVTGYYDLPFGLEFLRKPTVTQEDMLFDHSYAELAVLNARERAKSKKLTVMALEDEIAEVTEGFSSDGETEEEIDEAEEPASEESGEETASSTVSSQASVKYFSKKTPRRLPKFMQRDIPETREGILYENFRVFVKWALNLLKENEKLTELCKPSFVCVNLPEDLSGVLEAVNAEEEENGVSFVGLNTGKESEAICGNLELFGGLSPKYIAPAHKF